MTPIKRDGRLVGAFRLAAGVLATVSGCLVAGPVEATELTPFACTPCSGGNHSTINWTFSSETELPGYPLRGSLGSSSYENNLESRTVVFGSDYLQKVCFQFPEFATHDSEDVLSFSQQQGTQSYALWGDLVDESEPPLVTCVDGGSDSFQRRAFFMDFFTDNSDVSDGFEIDGLQYCCSDTPDGSSSSSALMGYQRNVGIWTGPDDVIHAQYPIHDDAAGLTIAFNPRGAADSRSNTIYTRCGARPTTTNWDSKSTVVGDNWFTIPAHDCPYPNSLFFAFEGDGAGVFDLWLSPYKTIARQTIRYNIHPDVSSVYHDDIEEALEGAARRLYAASEGAIQVEEFVESDLSYTVRFLDEVGRSGVPYGSYVHMRRDLYYNPNTDKTFETYSPGVVAHEILHRHFSLPDEYVDSSVPVCGDTIMSSHATNLNICYHPTQISNHGNHFANPSKRLSQSDYEAFVQDWKNEYGSEDVSGWDLLRNGGFVPRGVNWTPSYHDFSGFNFRGGIGTVTPLP